jgi:drug/metabolite transporter, DME family
MPQHGVRRYSPLTTLVFALGFGAFCLVVASRGLPPVPTDSILPVVYTTVFPTTLAYVLYTNGLRAIEAGRASVIATIESVIAAAGGAVLLREPFGATQWVGALLVIAGVVVVQGERHGPPRAHG